MNKTYYIISILVFLLIVLLVFYIFHKKKVKDLKLQVTKLERERNLIVSTPIMSELSKIDVIIKNEKLENKYEDWKQRYDVIKNERFAHITDLLLNVDALIDEKKYKEAKNELLNLDMEIYKVRVSTDNLLDEIREITMSEERNRTIVTKLKTRFRQLEKTLNDNKRIYGEVYKYIELQIENIEKKFQDFEVSMENNLYDEVVSIVKVLDEMIAHIGVVVEEVPDIILLTDKILPARIDEVYKVYEKLTSKNYPLDYLQVPHNIEQIEQKIKELKDRVKILNLEDVLFDLKTFLDYLDHMLNDFDIEKRSKKVFDEIASLFKQKITKTNKIVEDIYSQIDDIKSMYNLSTDDLNGLLEVNNNLFNANNEYNKIINELKNKEQPYSVLKEKMENLSTNFEQIELDLNSCLESLGSMHDDEVRAREQLNEITDLLKKCRLKIHAYSLPIISNNYFVYLSEANEAIYEIIKELDKVPITIKTLNIRVDTARDLSLKLYDTTNEMIKTAKLSEMTILYGNRYKAIDNDIERGLDVATEQFFKGDYKKSLEIAISAIRIVEPDIYEKMLKLYKTDN